MAVKLSTRIETRWQAYRPVCYSMVLFFLFCVPISIQAQTISNDNDSSVTNDPTVTSIQEHQSIDEVDLPGERQVDYGDITIRSEVLPKSVQVAEPVIYRVEVWTPENYVVKFGQLSGGDSDIVVADVNEFPDLPREGGGRLWRREWVVECYLSGKYTLPDASISLRGPEDREPRAYRSSTIQLEVMTVLEADADPREIRPAQGQVSMAEPASLSMLWWVGGGVGVSLIMALLGLFIIRELRKRREKGSTVEKQAMAAIEALQAEQLIERGLHEQFHIRLTNIVRAYIEKQFGVNAPLQTTQEFLIDLQRTPGELFLHQDLLRTFLDEADLVKFAATGSDPQYAVSAAIRFIQESAQMHEQTMKALKKGEANPALKAIKSKTADESINVKSPQDVLNRADEHTAYQGRQDTSEKPHEMEGRHV